MSIKEQVEDAVKLAQAGRRHSALVLLLIAIGASSRRMFTKAQVPGDGDAFRQFLGGRLQKILFGVDLGPDFPANSGVLINLNGKPIDLAQALYKFVRNGVVHEGEITTEVEFEDAAPVTGIMLGGSVNIHMVNGKLRFGNGWLEALVTVISRARCNAREFGFTFKDTVLKPGLNEQAIREACANGGLKTGAFDLIRDQMVFANVGELSSDAGLRAWFLRIVEQGTFNRGVVTGMKFSEPQLSDFSGNLTTAGVAVVRQIAEAHEIVQGP